ncbi:SRPBCC family protein, partial [Acinetobacter baumannii]
NPLIDSLTREQLWRGLVLRAESPRLFMPHLDDCRLSEKSLDSVRRELRYGELVIIDKVTYLPQIQVLYEVPSQGEIPA